MTKYNDYWEYMNYYFELAHALHRNPIPPLYNTEDTDTMKTGSINYDY